MQTKLETAQLRPHLSSMELARLVLSSYNGKLPFEIPDSKSLLNVEEKLAYWLNYKSFLKYKIQQFASQYEISSGNDFPEKLKNEIKQFLDKHIELKERKRKLPKLVLDDFKVTNYLEL
ncbi:hypothetical protein, partial [Legionella erythra]